VAKQIPNIRVYSVRRGVPSGYLVGRTAKGTGPTHLVNLTQLRRFGVGGVNKSSGGGGGGGGFNPFAGATLVAPTAGSFTLAQSGSGATVSNLASGRGVVFTIPSGSDTATISQAALSSTAMTWKAMLHGNFLSFGTHESWGLYMKDSAGNYVTTGVFSNEVYYGASFNGLSGGISNIWQATTATPIEFKSPFWYQMQIAGGNLISSVSYDGENFLAFDTRSISSMSGIFNGTPVEVGIWMNAGTPWNSQPYYINCYSFSVTTP
jgi:hypothetical protein